MKIHNPADGTVISEVTADNAAAVRRKYELARAGQVKWARAADRQAPGDHRRVSRAGRRHARDARANAHPRGRQADPPVAQRTDRPARPDRLLPRRLDARAARRESPRRRRRQAGGADHARAPRRRRQHLGLELSVLRRQQRVRARARGRQCRALQALGVRHADGPPHRRDAARSGRAARRVRAGHRRRRHRRGAHPAAGRRRLLHRLVRDRREDRGRRRASG